MRTLTLVEQNKIKLLTGRQVSFTLIEPTETGLNKSIMDATGSVRSFLKGNNIHDYETQKQGPESKIQIGAILYKDFSSITSTASLYRPKTKKGDPRIWFSGLNNIVKANEIVGIIFHAGRFHVFNLTSLDIEKLINSQFLSPFKELIEDVEGNADAIALELLEKLKKIAKFGPIPSVVAADTSVGRTLETALGIVINSSKQPDYKGIELKSFRSNRKNRKNLFAQVPDWTLSNFKSSAEILNTFGYQRGPDFKLYCTVSTITKNSQGLSLRIDSEIKHLIEYSENPKIGDFIIWMLDTLHSRLLEKHKETFWVEAKSSIVDGKEYFQYNSVEHTKKPIVTQFDLLIDQGMITLDHLIKRNSSGKVVEKGPLFKIKPTGIDLLFPPSKRYNLLTE